MFFPKEKCRWSQVKSLVCASHKHLLGGKVAGEEILGRPPVPGGRNTTAAVCSAPFQGVARREPAASQQTHSVGTFYTLILVALA
jgi:hypothetical protein